MNVDNNNNMANKNPPPPPANKNNITAQQRRRANRHKINKGTAHTIPPKKQAIIPLNSPTVKIVDPKKTHKPTVLIIETGNCHFELIPSWVYYFNQCGFNVFLKCRTVRPRNIYPILDKYKLKYKAISNIVPTNYDVIINNTFYPFNKISYLPSNENTNPRIKGSVVHVIKSFVDKRINNNNHMLITLANHMNDSAKKFTHKTTFLYPIFFRPIVELPKRILLNSQKRIFIVQGTFDTGRRNYNTLFKTIKQLKHRNDFVVVMIGSGGGLPKIKKQITPDIADKIKLAIGLTYEKFFGKLWTSHFILPLVDKQSSVNKAYFKDKITSSVMMGIGHILPIICDTKIEEIYGLENNQNCLSYSTQDEFTKKFIQAIEMKQPRYNTLINGTKKVYDSWIDISKNNIKQHFNNSK